MGDQNRSSKAGHEHSGSERGSVAISEKILKEGKVSVTKEGIRAEESAWHRDWLCHITDKSVLEFCPAKGQEKSGQSFPLQNAEVLCINREVARFLFSVQCAAPHSPAWVFEVPNKATRDEWLNALESHGAHVRLPLKEGLLHIKNEGLMTKRVQRYCVLYQHKLYYFKNAFDKDSEGEVDLPGTAVVEIDAVDKDKGDGLVKFTIAPHGDDGVKKFPLYATQIDRAMWVTAITNVIFAKESTINPKSLREGYLHGGFKKNALKKMYFILLEDRLACYKSILDKEEAESVPLPGGAVLELANDIGKGGFTLAPTGDEGEKVFYIAAVDENERSSWTSSINSLLSTKSSIVNENSLMEGYLHGATKKGQKMSKRYFILLKDKLQYFKSRNDARPEGAVHLDGGASVEVEYRDVLYHHTHLPIVEEKERQDVEKAKNANAVKINYVFAIAPTGDEGEKYYYMQAIDPKERMTWITVIQGLIDTKEYRVHKHSLREGYLLGGTKPKPEKRRYIVLLPDKIQYFKSRNDEKEEGHVLLPGGAVVEDVEGEIEPLTFIVAPSGDVKEKTKYYLTTRDEGHKDSWMNTIEELLATKDSKVNPQSIKEAYIEGGPKKTGHSKMYFILLTDRLQFFKSRKDKTPAGEILLPGGAVCELDEDDTGGDKKRPMFLVAPTGDEGEKEFYITTRSVGDRTRWMEAINTLLKSKNSQVNPKSLREGYLWLPGGWGGKGTKRYCVLLDEKLQVFKGRNDEKELSSVMLPGGAEVDLVEGDKDVRPNTFSVALTGDEGEHLNLFSARNGEERIEWMKALIDVIATKPSQVHPSSAKEGYLMVGPKKNGHRKRYCILLEDSFLFFKSRNDKRPEGEVPLPGGAVVEVNHNDDIEFPHLFSIAPTGDEGEKYLYITAKHDSQRNNWVSTIMQVLTKKNAQKIPGSLKEGYLMAGSKKDGLKRRYVVLTQDKIEIFKSRNDDKAQDEVKVAGGAVCETEDDSGPLGPAMFLVAVSGDAHAKALFFLSSGDTERDAWMTTVDDLLATKVSRVNPNSEREGYLWCSTSFKSGYKKRFFILLEDRLLFFKSRNDNKPEGEVLLPDGGAHCEMETKPCERNHVFSVAPSGDENEKYFYCAAKHDTERFLWTAKIQNVIDAKESLVYPNSIREGYLWGSWKKSTAGQSKYYFVLLADKLQYYASRKDPKPAGSIDLPGGAVLDTEEAEENNADSEANKNIFFVASSGDANAKKFYVFCEHQELREYWMQTIRQVIETKESIVNSNSKKEGYLRGTVVKSGQGKKMYFILLAEKVLYYKSRKDAKPEGEFPIGGGAVMKLMPEVHPLMFGISSCDDPGANHLYMTARDKRDLVLWVKTFEEIIATKNPHLHPNSVLEGYLDKKGFMNKYNRRYVCLTPTSLYYYVSREDPKPKEEYPIDKGATITVDSDGTTNFAFTITLSNKTKVSLAAPDQSAMVVWRSAIQGAIDGKPKLFEGILPDAMKRSDYSHVPNIVVECITYLKANGLDVEGIFRVPGNNDKIQDLKRQFEQQDRPGNVKLDDVHSVAGILKLYFRELSEALIPFSMYNQFIKIDDGAVENTDEKNAHLNELIASLPEINADNLNYLIHFLALVASHSAENKMHSQNCAMVFAPSLLRKPKAGQETASNPEQMMKQAQALVAEMEQSQHIIGYLIQGYKEIFPDGPPSPEKDANYLKDKQHNSTMMFSSRAHLSSRPSFMMSAGAMNLASPPNRHARGPTMLLSPTGHSHAGHALGSAHGHGPTTHLSPHGHGGGHGGHGGGHGGGGGAHSNTLGKPVMVKARTVSPQQMLALPGHSVLSPSAASSRTTSSVGGGGGGGGGSPSTHHLQIAPASPTAGAGGIKLPQRPMSPKSASSANLHHSTSSSSVDDEKKPKFGIGNAALQSELTKKLK